MRVLTALTSLLFIQAENRTRIPNILSMVQTNITRIDTTIASANVIHDLPSTVLASMTAASSGPMGRNVRVGNASPSHRATIWRTRYRGGEGSKPATDAHQSASKTSTRTRMASFPSTTATTSRFRATDDRAQLREPRRAMRSSTTIPLACTRVASDRLAARTPRNPTIP